MQSSLLQIKILLSCLMGKKDTRIGVIVNSFISLSKKVMTVLTIVNTQIIRIPVT